MKRTYDYASSRQRAMNAVIPARTDSYTPVPHSDFLEMLRTELNNARFMVSNERLYTNENGHKLVGFYDIRKADEELNPEADLTMMLGFRNSYDKSMRVGLAAGATVIICGNGVVMGDLMVYIKKHTGNVDVVIREKIQEAIAGVENSFAKLQVEVNVMKEVKLTRTQKAEILGRMYFDEEILTPTQLSVVKHELKHSEHFKEDNLWSLYNNVTEALKSSHPIRHIEDHIRLHTFMAGIAGIVPVRRVIEMPVTDAVIVPDVAHEPISREIVTETDETVREREETEAEALASLHDELIESATIIQSPVEEVIVDEGELAEAQDAIATVEEAREGTVIDTISDTPAENAGTAEQTGEIQ